MGIKKQIAFALSTCMLLTSGITASATSVTSYATNVSQQAGDGNTVITTNGDGNVVTNGNGNTVVFIDVPDNYWAKEQISQFAQEGIINGYSDGSFRPQANVTREEFCKLLVMAFKQPATNLPNGPTFSDVLENRWSYGYVEACREFLTGYANPFGGRPAFHPTENATREDIAVALVRMMGYTESDAPDADYAVNHFNDGDNISPQLRAYVSIAYKKGLITGYPDGTFRPSKGVTRAEVVVMLNRATKQAFTDINADLDMTASLDYSSDKKTAIVQITAEQGAAVTVNGESVAMSSNYFGESEGRYTYQFTEEGSKEFIVTGSRAGKTKTITLTGSYAIHLPELQIDNCPTTVGEQKVTISGSIYSQFSSVKLTLNGKQIQTAPADERRSWSKVVTLTEGENTLTFVLTDQEGQKVTQTKTITYAQEGPVLKITECPSTSSTKEVTIKGTMRDANNGATLTLNGKYVSRVYAGNKNEHSWSATYELQEGANTLNFELTNDSGKTVKETRTVQFSAGAPSIRFIFCPETTQTQDITLRFNVEDATNDVHVYVNDKEIYSYSSSYTYPVTLEPGDNIFKIRAVNNYGKDVVEIKVVNYNDPKSNEKPSNDNDNTNTNNNANINNNNDNQTVLQGDFIDQVLQLVNQERANEGLSALETTSALNQAAQVRANEQAEEFSHTRPDGSSCFTALDEAGISYMAAGENIAWGQRTPEAVMDSWMNSSGHRANILSSSFTKIGVGYVNDNGSPYWVQLFIG